MAVKIRLARHGRKASPFYHIVAADSRRSRDGRFIEKIGTYNPKTNPATVELKFDRALYWLEVGAETTDTARSILQKEGVLYMKHLKGGVKKGAFDEAAAEAKFAAWTEANDARISGKKDGLAQTKADARNAALAAEAKKKEEKAAAVAAKNAPVAEETPAEGTEAPASEETEG